MKTLFLIAFITFFSCSYGQIKVELFFNDNCTDSIIRLEYELNKIDSFENFYQSTNYKIIVPEKGRYFLSTGIEKGDLIGLFFTSIEIKDTIGFIDTLFIPMIRFTVEKALHSQYWNYFNCDKLCDGEEIDHYANGNIRLKGLFVEGKPGEISEYRENGTIETNEIYKLGFQDFKKIEYFDNNGLLEKYEIYKNRKRKTIIISFNSNDKVIEKKVNKH
jgi:hypothetical protein